MGEAAVAAKGANLVATDPRLLVHAVLRVMHRLVAATWILEPPHLKLETYQNLLSSWKNSTWRLKRKTRSALLLLSLYSSAEDRVLEGFRQMRRKAKPQGKTSTLL